MLQTDGIRKIKGIGEIAEKTFQKMNIFSVEDLLAHYPRDYDQFKPIQFVNTMEEGRIASVEVFLKNRATIKQVRALKILSVIMEDRSGQFLAIWYNMPFLLNQLRMGTKYILRGKVTKKNGMITMEQPKIFKKEEFYKNMNKLLPIYSLTKGLTNNGIQKGVRTALKEVEGLVEYLPADIRKRRGLMDYKKAIHSIHFPGTSNELKKARRRLVFDELFLYTLALCQLKNKGKQVSKYLFEEREEIHEFIKTLPFELTSSQKSVYQDVAKDLYGGNVMNRLVQGDVGSGKTVVAILALLLTVKNGYQGAFMVPTEVLAMQHYKTLQVLLEPYGVNVGLLVGSLTAKTKREGHGQLLKGEWDIVVGTHAIIQEKVKFHNLALVITDEQHRFGVKQRENLFEKGLEPHVLAMSATPIPRSLALVLYGDMDLSVMDTLPANRLPIKNCVVGTEYRQKAYEFMKNEIREDHQVYIICPMVEESESMDLENVTLYTEELKRVFDGNIRIQGLHGKMKPNDKNEIMERFEQGEIDILVSTTVIEVGIDVPNATTILIENAERFGLAQLHQLRGRVGRGKEQSYCILMAGTKNKEAKERLSILASSNDGFFIAAEDLKLRGQGDLFGIQQSGDKIFLLADVYEDAKVLLEAQEEAKQMSEDDIVKLCKKNNKLMSKLNQYS